MHKAGIHKFTGIVIAVFVIFAIISLSCLVGTAYSSSNFTVYNIQEKPFGVPYQNWVAKWWNWTFGIPADTHPRDDPTRSCNVHQERPVWFLPDPLNIEDKSTLRICDIPLGKAIFVPIVTGEVSTVEKPGYSDGNLMKEALTCDNFSKVRNAEIDGSSVNGLNDKSTYRTNSSEVFNVTIASDNIYNIKPGTGRAFADGWFLFLNGLTTGEHKLHLVGSIDSPDQSCNSSGDVNWLIRVK